MAAKPVRVAFVSDTSDLRRELAKAEASLEGAAATAKESGDKIGRSMDGAAEGADEVASKGSQAAGALSGLGDLVGGKFGGAMVVGGTAMQAAADAGDLLNVAVEGGAKLMGKAKNALVAMTKAETYATIAKKVGTGVQWALNAAMAANPIGLVVLAIVALVAIFAIAWARSEKFREICRAAMDGVRKAVDNLREKGAAALGKFRDALGSVTAWAGSLRAKVVGGFTAVVDYIRSVPGKIRALAGKFRDAGASIMGKIVDGIRASAGFVGKIASGIWNAIKGLINGAIGKINAALDFTIRLPLGKSLRINAPNIPYLASGGIVSSPTLAVIGEAGPEAVVPLNGRYALGSSTTVNVTLTVPPTANPAAVGKEVQRVLDAYAREGGRRAA